MKLCGFKESCFINGEKVWGHCGGVMCLYLSERKAKPENIGVCEITNEDDEETTRINKFASLCNDEDQN